MARLMIVHGRPSFGGAPSGALGGDAAEQAFLDAAMGCCNADKCCSPASGEQWESVVRAWLAMSVEDRQDIRSRTLFGPMVDVPLFERLSQYAPAPPPKAKAKPPRLVVRNLSPEALNAQELLRQGRAARISFPPRGGGAATRDASDPGAPPRADAPAPEERPIATYVALGLLAVAGVGVAWYVATRPEGA